MANFRILNKTYNGVNGIQIRDTDGNPVECFINGASWDNFADGLSDMNVVISTTPAGYSFYKKNLKTLTIKCDNAITIGTYAFSGCTNLETVTFDCTNGAVNMNSYAFSSCTNLKTVSYTNCGNNIPEAGSYGFNGCSKLETLNKPYKFGLSDRSFKGCSKFGPYFIANVSGIWTETFASCTSLLGIDLGASRLATSDSSRTNMFNGATKLRDLIIRKSNAVWALANIAAFTNTPFATGKTGGILYIPSSLIASYQTATNWTTLFGTARATGYANNHVSPLEGSVYEYLFLDETPVSDSLGTIPTLKVFKGKGVDSTGITTDANMAITAPFAISTANPINIHWNKFEATNATCAFRNCLTSTTDIDTSTEGNFIPYDMKGLDGTSSTYTEWMTSGGVNFVGIVDNDLFADTTYSTSYGYGRLVFKNKTDDTAAISDTIEGYVTIQGTLYHLVEAPIEEYE